MRAAGTGTARVGTATAAAADRSRRTDAEAGTVTGLNEINFDVSAGDEESFFDQKGQVVLVEDFVVGLWLVQSQSQRGTCSATLHQGDANGRVNTILL